MANTENNNNYGAIFGVAESMRKATEAMEELAKFLPDDFMWPTGIHASPGKVMVEWAQAPLKTSEGVTLGNSVWLDATPNGVRMHAFFRQEHPYVMGVDEEFRPDATAALLMTLTEDWAWRVLEDGTPMCSSPATKPLPSDVTDTPDAEHGRNRVELGQQGIDTVCCRVGALEVRGRGVPHVSAIWNNEIGRSSVAILVPYTDEVEAWTYGIVRNGEEGYIRPFEVVYEDADKTARLVMSGEGAVWPHPFRRNSVVAIVIMDIPYLARKATDLTKPNA